MYVKEGNQSVKERLIRMFTAALLLAAAGHSLDVPQWMNDKENVLSLVSVSHTHARTQ